MSGWKASRSYPVRDPIWVGWVDRWAFRIYWLPSPTPRFWVFVFENLGVLVRIFSTAPSVTSCCSVSTTRPCLPGWFRCFFLFPCWVRIVASALLCCNATFSYPWCIFCILQVSVGVNPNAVKLEDPSRSGLADYFRF